MKISLNWIKDYAKLPDDLDLSRLTYDLTMSTVEVEGAERLADRFDGMCVGRIVEVLPHPNADKLRVCRTDIGGGAAGSGADAGAGRATGSNGSGAGATEAAGAVGAAGAAPDGDGTVSIVCGGINLYDGMKVAVAKPGAMVKWHGEGDPVKIGKTKLRGVESYGMICASAEIGLFDLFPAEAESEIIDLSEFDSPAGTPLAVALGLDDVILEVDNKSLTNRPDLWGHYGIAREITALRGLPLERFEPYGGASVSAEGKAAAGGAGGEFRVTIADEARCPRYIGVKIDGVSPAPSPYWLRSRIWRVGMRPINAIVDITNYVMLATGQPTHAFDADHIVGHIDVRRARDGEPLTLLDGRRLSLSADDLVIADDENAVALAGVMGGVKDSVLPDTNRAILEIAAFDALGVRRTASRHEARTEAAIRYEKAIDPERCDIALSLAMRLFSELHPGMRVSGFMDNRPSAPKRSKITLSLDWLWRRLGKRLPLDETCDKLARLGFDASSDGDLLNVVAPTFRSTGDVSIPDDIVEEVARMHGFENFEATPITTSFDGAINQPCIDIERRIKEYLAFRCGYREVLSYPWMSDEHARAFFETEEGILALATPPSPTERLLRASLLPNLCKAAVGNLRFFNEFSIFETAQALFDRDYAPARGDISAAGGGSAVGGGSAGDSRSAAGGGSAGDSRSAGDPRELLPLMRRHAAGICVSGRQTPEELFRQAKGAVEAMPRYAHFGAFSFAQEQKPYWADDSAWQNVMHSGERIGDLALLSGKTARACGVKAGFRIMAFEIDIDALEPFASRTNAYTRLPEYPLTEYDLSVLVELDATWEDILAAVTAKRKSEPLLRDVRFVGEYRGKQVPEGKKSVTLRLVIGSLERTLTMAEIDKYAGNVLARLERMLGAKLRDQ